MADTPAFLISSSTSYHRHRNAVLVVRILRLPQPKHHRPTTLSPTPSLDETPIDVDAEDLSYPEDLSHPESGLASFNPEPEEDVKHIIHKPPPLPEGRPRLSSSQPPLFTPLVPPPVPDVDPSSSSSEEASANCADGVDLIRPCSESVCTDHINVRPTARCMNCISKAWKTKRAEAAAQSSSQSSKMKKGVEEGASESEDLSADSDLEEVTPAPPTPIRTGIPARATVVKTEPAATSILSSMRQNSHQVQRSPTLPPPSASNPSSPAPTLISGRSRPAPLSGTEPPPTPGSSPPALKTEPPASPTKSTSPPQQPGPRVCSNPRPYIFIGIQLNPAPMGFRGNSKKDPSPSVAPAPPSRREEDSPASENASACPSDSGCGERRSGGDGELASSSISGALQHQFQPGILARFVCLLGVDNLESTFPLNPRVASEHWARSLEISQRLWTRTPLTVYVSTCFGGMLRCVDLLPPPDDISFLKTVHTIYVQHHKFPEALSVAIRLNDPDLIREDFNAPEPGSEWLPDDNTDGDTDVDFADDLPEDLLECLSNTRLSTHFREFEKGGVADAKASEDVYKSHLENTGLAPLRTLTPPEVTWLAFSSIALVNAGFGSDKLMVEAEEGNSWTYKNKDHGIQCRCISSSQLVVGHRLTSTSTPTHRRRTSRRSSCHWYSGKADSEDKSLDESWERYMALGLGLQDSSDTSKPSTTQYRRRRRSSLRLAPSLAPVAFSASRPCLTGILWETSRDDPETVQPRAIRKSVPLAIGLISASNPQLPVLDTLSRYSHDNDPSVALNAIFAMGLVGAGINNVRLAQVLRQLAGV
ncbi:hypothetical protein DFP72DRAFT_1091248 [Ephemerocybe angulata]|uniref:RPN1 N-terminal domain-containing protein n=1 Tax=Ephemerocybe angulata TaxID=980116 RepID=A0A8H6HFR1_9AGAR|nr:hypothetical protein DFP72DRAFT_1091248 [Tulosesus angulatus]